MLTNPKLWTRLENYEIGYSKSALSFTDRLARDNEWSAAFASRAVLEYKRFVYLALTGDGPATPSDEVDQVWHLHLLYTRDYWGPFTNLLGAPLHHGPTPGGKSARTGYQGAYQHTKSFYAAEFEQSPPSDLWPSDRRRFTDPMHYRRVDLRHYRRRKTSFSSSVPKAAAVGLSLVAISAVAHDSLGDSYGLGEWARHIWESHRLFGLFVAAILLLVVFGLFNGGAGGPGDSGCSGCSGCGGCGG